MTINSDIKSQLKKPNKHETIFKVPYKFIQTGKNGWVMLQMGSELDIIKIH